MSLHAPSLDFDSRGHISRKDFVGHSKGTGKMDCVTTVWHALSLHKSLWTQAKQAPSRQRLPDWTSHLLHINHPGRLCLDCSCHQTKARANEEHERGDRASNAPCCDFFLCDLKKEKGKATGTAQDKRKRDCRQRAASKQSMGVR